MTHVSDVPDPELDGLAHGWRGALIAFSIPYFMVTPLALYGFSQALVKPTMSGPPTTVNRPLVPTSTFKEPRGPRNTNHLDCLVETA